MYEAFFQMKHTPFSRGIPVEEMYTDPDMQEIHDRLIYTAQKQLFSVLIADAGMGKTAMLRRFRESLRKRQPSGSQWSPSSLSHYDNGLHIQASAQD